MKVIFGKRGQLKSTELIKESAEKWFYIVCISANEASRLFYEARNLGYNIPYPITFDDFVHKRYSGKGIKGFLIDNADLLLQRMSSVKIHAVSITLED